MLLTVVDKQEMKERQAMDHDTPVSFVTRCTELQPNSTATIVGKKFDISTMKCTTTDRLSSQLGITENVDDTFMD